MDTRMNTLHSGYKIYSDVPHLWRNVHIPFSNNIAIILFCCRASASRWVSFSIVPRRISLGLTCGRPPNSSDYSMRSVMNSAYYIRNVIRTLMNFDSVR